MLGYLARLRSTAVAAVRSGIVRHSSTTDDDSDAAGTHICCRHKGDDDWLIFQPLSGLVFYTPRGAEFMSSSNAIACVKNL